MVLLLLTVVCTCLVSLLFCSSKSSSKGKTSADKTNSPGKRAKTTPTGRKGEGKTSNGVESKQPSPETKPDVTTGNEMADSKKRDDKPEKDKGPNNDDELKFGEVVDDDEPRTNFDSVDENENPFCDNQLQEKLKNGRKKHSTAPTVRTKKSKTEYTGRKTIKTTQDSPEQTQQSTNRSATSKHGTTYSKEKITKTKRARNSTNSKLSMEKAKQSTKLDTKA